MISDFIKKMSGPAFMRASACSMLAIAFIGCSGESGESADEDSPAFDLSFGVYGYTAADLASTGPVNMPIALNTGDTVEFTDDIFNNGYQFYTLDGAFQLVVQEQNGNQAAQAITNPYVYTVDPAHPDSATFNETQTIENSESFVISTIDVAVGNAVAAGSSTGIAEVLEVPDDFDSALSFIDLPSNSGSTIVSVLRSAGVVAAIGSDIGYIGDPTVYVRSYSNMALTTDTFDLSDEDEVTLSDLGIDIDTLGVTSLFGTTYPELNEMITSGTTPTITGTANLYEVWHALVYRVGDTHAGVAYQRSLGRVVNYIIETPSSFTMTLNGAFD